MGNAAGSVLVWNLALADSTPARLQALARLSSGQRIHAARGSFVPLDADELREALAASRAP